ncbi:MAG: DUF4136 domain-containing protein [Nitrospira sp. CR1.3]|nr:DUF4136 domain-containing protein [Nitrospira sp. CR1.3]
MDDTYSLCSNHFSWEFHSDTILIGHTLMKWNPSLSWLSPLVLAAACASSKVGYDYDRSANFSSYHTYEWMQGNQEPTGDKRVDNQLVDARIRTAIDAQLRSKGYGAPAAGKPDFYVAYHAGVKDLTKGASTQRYIGDRATGTYTTISDIQPYKEGALLIDIVDAASQRLVWQGTASSEVDPGMTAKERDVRVNQVVRSIMAHFPPQ